MVINSPSVSLKNPNESIHFNPVTSSPYTLKVTEKLGASSFCIYDGDDPENYFHRLNHLPFKPIDATLSLVDLKSFTNSCLKQREFVNLLVAIRYMKPAREISTKKGPKLYREIIVMDQTLAGMSLSIWNMDYIRLSDSWIPQSTILFLSDVRVDFSEYLKSIALCVSSRTIILDDPIHQNAVVLKQYAESVPISNFDLDKFGTPDLATIIHVMTAQKLYDLSENGLESAEEQFTALVYATVTRFDIDGDDSKVICRRCIKCRQKIHENFSACQREDCSRMEMAPGQHAFTKSFDIAVDLSDHTGTVTGCRLMDEAAEKLLGFGWDVFELISESDRTASKWKYLMKRCTAKLLIKKKTVCRPRQFISILELRLSTMEEIANHVKLY